MSRDGRQLILFVESNTSGTGPIFVHAARRLGFRPMLVTARPERYPYLSKDGAPEVIVVPRIDEDELYEAIHDRFGDGGAVAGITSSSEHYVATAAALASRFCLPGPDAARVRAARDKVLQREMLASAGLPVPAFRSVTSPVQAMQAACEIGYPVVIKPAEGTGSVGVRLCTDAAEAAAHAASLCVSSAEEPVRMLVESLISGAEFSVEVFSGQVIGITRKHLGHPPRFVEVGHDYPADLSGVAADRLRDAASRATEVLGLAWGPVHWEFRVQGTRATAIEVNPRLAGGFIPELVRRAEGVDLIRETVRLAAGQQPALTPTRRRFASIRFLFAPGAGRLACVTGLEAARALPNIADVMLYREIGEELCVQGDFRDRIGHVVGCADGREDAASATQDARGTVRIRVETVRGGEGAASALAWLRTGTDGKAAEWRTREGFDSR